MRETVDSERPRMRASSLLERSSRSAARKEALVTSAPSARGSGWADEVWVGNAMCNKYIAKLLEKLKAGLVARPGARQAIRLRPQFSLPTSHKFGKCSISLWDCLARTQFELSGQRDYHKDQNSRGAIASNHWALPQFQRHQLHFDD